MKLIQWSKTHAYTIINNIVRVFILCSIILFLFQKDFGNIGYLGIAFILTFYDKIVEKIFKIQLETPLKLSILALIFTAQCLGSVYGWYGRFPWWDTVVHGCSGVIFFYIGITLIEQINQKLTKKILHPIIKILFAICFSLAIGVLWEFLEFTIDKFFGGNMQDTKNFCGQAAIWDTIQDLAAATVGTIFGTVIEGIRFKIENKGGKER